MNTIATSDGGFVTVTTAAYDSLNPGAYNGQDIARCIVKTDSCGKLLWKTHGDPGDGDDGRVIVENDSGDYITLGAASFQQATHNFRLAKFSKTGQLKWINLFSGQTESVPFCMIKRKNKDAYVAGGSLSHDYANQNYHQNPYVIEVNDDGKLVKSAELAGFNIGALQYYWIAKILEKNDTSYLMVVHTNLTQDTIYIVETDTNFNTRWISKPFVGSNFGSTVNFDDACLSYDKKYLILTLVINIPPAVTCPTIAQISLGGNLIKYKILSDTALFHYPQFFPEPSCIAPTPDNGYVIGDRILLVDSNFNTTKFFYNKFRGNFSSIVLNKDMSITASGVTLHWDSIHYQLYIVKIDSSGKLIYNSVQETQKYKINEELIIYPNPATYVLNIQTSSNQKLAAQLFDVTGKQVTSTILFTNNTTINTSSLNQGLYFVRITDANGAVVKTQKVAVVK